MTKKKFGFQFHYFSISSMNKYLQIWTNLRITSTSNPWFQLNSCNTYFFKVSFSSFSYFRYELKLHKLKWYWKQLHLTSIKQLRSTKIKFHFQYCSFLYFRYELKVYSHERNLNHQGQKSDFILYHLVLFMTKIYRYLIYFLLPFS